MDCVLRYKVLWAVPGNCAVQEGLVVMTTMMMTELVMYRLWGYFTTAISSVFSATSKYNSSVQLVITWYMFSLQLTYFFSFSSGHGFHMWRSRQLQPCYKQLSSFTHPAPGLSEDWCPTSCCFQWLEKTTTTTKNLNWGKDLPENFFDSTLKYWVMCSDFLTEACSRLLEQQPA